MTRPNGRSRTRVFSGIPSESPGSGTGAPRALTNPAEFTRSADAQSESPIRRSPGTDEAPAFAPPEGAHRKAASSPAAQDRRPSDGAGRAASPRGRRPTPGDQRRLSPRCRTSRGPPRTTRRCFARSTWCSAAQLRCPAHRADARQEGPDRNWRRLPGRRHDPRRLAGRRLPVPGREWHLRPRADLGMIFQNQ